MLTITSSSFDDVRHAIRAALLKSPVVKTGEWQAIRDAPQSDMIEVEDVSIELPMAQTLSSAQEQYKPNLPWAEDHFLERVSGFPHNPPPSHEWWPFAQKNNAEHVDDQRQFSHTYPERYWPRNAGKRLGVVNDPHWGIRFAYGDLNDLVRLLADRPGTRQAYLPVWFPEDLRASAQGERVPCSLGYHFMIRNRRLKIVYYIRSCDFLRHFCDDVYMTVRLAQWVRDHLEVELEGIALGKFVMHVSSMHAFSADRGMIKMEHEAETQRRLTAW